MIKNLITRALSGAVYVVLLVGCTVYSPLTANLFYAIMAAACIMEFGTVVNRHYGASLPRPINALGGFLLVTAVWMSCMGGQDTAKIFAPYGFTMLFILVRELYAKAEDPLRNWTLCFASQLYIAVPFALLPLMSVSQMEGTGDIVYQCILPLALFVFLWCNDSGAYLVGCTLSRFFPAKLFPRISPKKSWVGSIGGALLTLGVSVLIHSYFPAGMPLWRWMGFALTVVVFGTWGDLVESLLKRQLGIKDSGNVMPGHGGFLDRFDSALLAIPAVVIYMIVTQ